MDCRDDYLVTKVIGDRFIALSNKNLLTTWSILTGKMICCVNEFKGNQDYTNFEIYRYGPQHVAY